MLSLLLLPSVWLTTGTRLIAAFIYEGEYTVRNELITRVTNNIVELDNSKLRTFTKNNIITIAGNAVEAIIAIKSTKIAIMGIPIFNIKKTNEIGSANMIDNFFVRLCLERCSHMAKPMIKIAKAFKKSQGKLVLPSAVDT